MCIASTGRGSRAAATSAGLRLPFSPTSRVSTFAHLKDIWWHDAEEPIRAALSIEPDTVFDGRVREFRAWLSARPETLIAVVGHGTFFYHLTGEQLPNCGVAALEALKDPVGLIGPRSPCAPGKPMLVHPRFSGGIKRPA